MNFMPLEAQVSTYVEELIFTCYFFLFNKAAYVVICIVDWNSVFIFQLCEI